MVSKGGCLGWLKKRTNLEKTLLSLSSLLLLTLLLMILIGIAFRGKNTENTPEDESQCWSKDCIQTAGDILRKIDPAAESCGDFYEYACGKYGLNPGQTVSVPKQSTDSVYFSLKRLMESKKNLEVRGLNEARSFYDTCVKFGSHWQDLKETGNSLRNLMSEMQLYTWPIIDSLYDTTGFSRERTLANLILLDVPVAFKMEIVPDEQIPGSSLIKISPGYPHESGRSTNEIRGDVHLRSSVLTSFVLLGSSEKITDVNDIIAVDSNFAAIEQDDKIVCDDVLLAPEEALSELKRLIPEMDWKIVLSEIRNATGLPESRNLAVELHCKQRIRDYVVHLNDLSERIEMNYLGWRFFSKFVEHVVPTFEKSQFGSDEVVPRWRICLELMEKFSSPVLADLLTNEIITQGVIAEAERISNASLAAAKRLVHRAQWLTDNQRSRVLKKISQVRTRFPFHRTSSVGELAKLKIPQVDVNNFTAVVIHHQRKMVIQRFKSLNQEAESLYSIVSRTPLLTARSDSDPSDSLVYIYFDKIRNPYIQLQASQWLNYGGFGVTISREISRLLLTLSAGNGNEENSLVWNLFYKSSNLSRCLLTSLAARSGMHKEVLTVLADEKLLQNLFLDQSAIEIAYEAAKSTSLSSKSLPNIDLSDEKLFFLSYAQTQCEADLQVQKPKHISVRNRLNSALSNFDSFKQVFSCAPSSNCQIWA